MINKQGGEDSDEAFQRDRLVTADSGTTASYSYDGDGRRVKKTVSGSTTLYFYDNEGKLLEEYDPSTGIGKDYIWLPGTYQPLARIDFSLADSDNGNVLRNTKSGSDVHLDWSLDGNSGPYIVERSTSFSFSSPQSLGSAQSAKTFDDAVLTDGNNYAYKIYKRSLTDTLYFYHDDHLGTPLAMTNTSGSFVWQAEQYPFGGIYALTVGTISNNLRFPGQYWDGETGLAQNWFRNYRSSIGRYWETDPEGLNTGLTNLYPYAAWNPLIHSDHDGKQIVGLIIVGIGFAAWIGMDLYESFKGPPHSKVPVVKPRCKSCHVVLTHPIIGPLPNRKKRFHRLWGPEYQESPFTYPSVLECEKKDPKTHMPEKPAELPPNTGSPPPGVY